MDICHLKNAELETKHQKHKGRVVLRGDIVKDDSESSVLIQQGSSASQITAAKVMDIKSRLPGAQDKQRMQHLFIPRSKWKMLQKYWKVPNRNVQTFGSVYRDRSGQNHDPVWKTQSFFLNEICTVIFWQDCCWKGNAYSYTLQRFILICVCGWHQIARKEEILIRCGKYSKTKLIWEIQHHSLITYTWVCPQRQCETSKDIVDNYRTMFESRNSRRSNWKITMFGKSAYLFVVLWHGRTCQEMCGRIFWVGEQNDSTTLQSINIVLWRPFISNKNWNPWENCQKYALRLSWNGKIWHVLEYLIFYGQWTRLHDRSQNGPKLVINDNLVWSLTFIIHVNTNSIVMWETLPNNAGCDCFKTPFLQETLRIQNLLQLEHCAFSIRLWQSVGCARNKLQSRTVQQNKRSFLWMLDWDWTENPHLICVNWSFQFLKHDSEPNRTERPVVE